MRESSCESGSKCFKTDITSQAQEVIQWVVISSTSNHKYKLRQNFFAFIIPHLHLQFWQSHLLKISYLLIQAGCISLLHTGIRFFFLVSLKIQSFSFPHEKKSNFWWSMTTLPYVNAIRVYYIKLFFSFFKL